MVDRQAGRGARDTPLQIFPVEIKILVHYFQLYPSRFFGIAAAAGLGRPLQLDLSFRHSSVFQCFCHFFRSPIREFEVVRELAPAIVITRNLHAGSGVPI